MFLAVLELVRHHQVRAEQNLLFGELWIMPGHQADAPLDLSRVDEYEHGGPEK
jgi:segregation and condensation protein A